MHAETKNKSKRAAHKREILISQPEHNVAAQFRRAVSKVKINCFPGWVKFFHGVVF